MPIGKGQRDGERGDVCECDEKSGKGMSVRRGGGVVKGRYEYENEDVHYIQERTRHVQLFIYTPPIQK